MDWPVRRRGPSAAEGDTRPDAEASHDARKTGAESSSISPSFVSVSVAPRLRSSHARTACALPDAVTPSAPSAEVDSMAPKTRVARQRVRKRRINRLVNRWGHSNIHRDTSKLLQGPQQRKKVPGPPFIMAIHQRLMDKTRLAHRKNRSLLPAGLPTPCHLIPDSRRGFCPPPSIPGGKALYLPASLSCLCRTGLLSYNARHQPPRFLTLPKYRQWCITGRSTTDSARIWHTRIGVEWYQGSYCDRTNSVTRVN